MKNNKLLKNATIYTADDNLGVIESGYIYVNKSGKIASVGSIDNLETDIKVNRSTESLEKNDLEEIDFSGKFILPGFVDAHTHLGICESYLSFEGDDANEMTDPVTPHLRALDATNPLDPAFKEALRYGVTSVVISPGSANPIGGEIFAMKTYGNSIDEMIIKNKVGIKFALGENPKNTYSEREESPTTRMATAALIREALFKAKRYYEDREKSFKSDDFSAPEYDIKSEALIPVLKNEIKAFFHAHRADDICTAIRIAKEFNLDYVLVHCTQGPLIADYLDCQNAKILLGPIISDNCKPELSGLSSKTPSCLAKKKNICFSIMSDHPETPVQYLLLSCKIAIEEGLNKTDALKTITINPAKICGIDGRVGSIKKGKDADLLVFVKDPFKNFLLKPDNVFIDGAKIF